MEHVPARVLSTTNDENNSRKENAIREVTDRDQEGDQVTLDIVDSEGESKGEAIDAEVKEIQQKFNDVSGDTVLNFFFTFSVCVGCCTIS